MPIFDHKHAKCDGCALKKLRLAKPSIEVLSRQPDSPLGSIPLMFVAQSPGGNEVLKHEVLIGRAGEMFNNLILTAGVDRRQVWLANALLCRPPNNNMKLAVGAIEGCNNRLFDEIWHFRPRVIVALGSDALKALIGEVKETNVSEPGVCSTCEGRANFELAVAPWLKESGRNKMYAKGATPSALIPCRDCKGKGQKNFKKPVRTIVCDWTITKCAGAIFDVSGPLLAHCRRYFPPQTKYIVGTYHPSFLLRDEFTKVSQEGAKDDKRGSTAVAGPFLIPASVRHIERAKKLLEVDVDLNVEWYLLDEDTDQAVEDYRRFLGGSGPFSVDLEAEPVDGNEDNPDPANWRPTVIGVARRWEGRPVAMVIDARGWPRKLIREFVKFMGDESKSKLGQNFGYDVNVSEAWMA